MFKRCLNLITALWHYARWCWRFHSFGWRSRLGRCDMLTRPAAIHIGRKVLIRKGARLEVVGDWDGQAPKLTIGDGSAIQFYFHCGAAESVVIGKNVLIAGRVYITDHDHSFDDPKTSARKDHRLISKPVVIEDEAWLGEGCAILKGVTIGRRAVVGANAVVTRDVPAFSVVGGVPAKVLRQLDQAEPAM